jgi:ketosteroid isomerase-like protein
MRTATSENSSLMSQPEDRNHYEGPAPACAAALAFLQAYWRGSLEDALASATMDAVIELPRSIPLPSPAPLAQVLPLIFGRIYSCFANGRFDIHIERCLVDGEAVIVEYTATGDLVSGRVFRCRYLVILEMQAGRVARFRPYTDTKYVDDELFVRLPNAHPGRPEKGGGTSPC